MATRPGALPARLADGSSAPTGPAESVRRRVDGQLGRAHERPAFDLAQAAKLDVAGQRAGKRDILERRVVVPSSLRERRAPGLAIVGDADLEVLDAAVGAVLAGDVEEPLDASRGSPDRRPARADIRASRRQTRCARSCRGRRRRPGPARNPGRSYRRRASRFRPAPQPTTRLRGSNRGWLDRPGCSVLSHRGPPTWDRPVGLEASAPPWPCGLRGLRRIRLASGSPRLTTLSAEL